jgi:Zn-dependent protease with chaperone function
VRAARALAAALVCAALPAAAQTARPAKVSLDGYAEWRRGELLIVDGQRVRAGAGLRFKGRGDAREFGSIPLGYEVKVEGTRLADGVVLAREVDARPNGDALFEGDLRAAFDQIEQRYRRRSRVFEEDANGRVTSDLGELREEGPEWRRVRRITDDLLPRYRRPEEFRVYVVANPEWNAMAAPNGSIFVFSGLLEAMDDDEVAIVLGHELVHATHEHSRKQYKKELFIQLGTLGALAAAETIDNDTKRIALQAVALLATSAWTSGYGRSHEDQADRVGLRYAAEGGYAVERGPALWRKFAAKYGEGNKIVNFFFSDHSQSLARSRNLERELALNYPQR